jgi:hypothetical protein
MYIESLKTIGHRRPGTPAQLDPQTNTNHGRRKLA